MNARPQTALDTLSFDDGVLLARHAGGDDGALEKLLERNRPRVTAFVRGKVFDTLVVDDLVQETMLRAWVGVRSFAGESSFGTWLHAIARNVCIDHIRRSGRKREVPFDDAVSDAARRATAPMDRVPDARLRPADRAAADAQFRGELERALGGLPTGQREAFVMRGGLELKFAEIAERVGIGVPTAKSRVRYAVERLQEALEEFRVAVSGEFAAVPVRIAR